MDFGGFLPRRVYLPRSEQKTNVCRMENGETSIRMRLHTYEYYFNVWPDVTRHIYVVDYYCSGSVKLEECNMFPILHHFNTILTAFFNNSRCTGETEQITPKQRTINTQDCTTFSEQQRVSLMTA